MYPNAARNGSSLMRGNVGYSHGLSNIIAHAVLIQASRTSRCICPSDGLEIVPIRVGRYRHQRGIRRVKTCCQGGRGIVWEDTGDLAIGKVKANIGQRDEKVRRAPT